MEDSQPYIVACAYYMLTPAGYFPNQEEYVSHLANNETAQWASDNSLNGLHLFTERNMEYRVITLELVALTTNEKATFWKLKFSGR